MAWTAPKSWAVNETLTAANLNTHLQANLNWLANDRPRCGAIRSTAQSIADNTSTAISFTDADEFDVGPMHDTSTNPSRCVVPSGGGGLYLVIGQLSWATLVGSTRRALNFNKNGAGISGIGDFRVPDNTGNCAMSVSFMIPLVATDYIELIAYQNSGGALNANARLQMIWQAF